MKRLLIFLAVALTMSGCKSETFIEEFKNEEKIEMATILSPIEFRNKVRSTLGAATDDCGLLCTHPNINKWSKWKPVRYNKDVGITESELRSVNCGLLKYEETTNFKLLIPSALMWFYLKPRGGSVNEFYRIGDFRNYNHNGLPPIISIPANTITVNKITDPILTMEIEYVTQYTLPQNDQSIMRIEDLNVSIGNLYYAVVFEWLGQAYIKTAYYPVSEYGRTVTFNFSNEYPLNLISTGQDSYNFYNVLSNTRVLEPTLLTDISPSVLFSPLPISDDADNISKVKLMASSGLGFTPRKVSPNDYYNWGSFIDIPYYPPTPPLVSNADIALLVEVSNQTANSIQLPLSGWEINANPTFWGPNSNYFTCSLVNAETGTILITPPVINPGETYMVGISVYNLLNRNGTSISAVNTKETIVTSINFRNGIYKGNLSLHVTSQE